MSSAFNEAAPGPILYSPSSSLVFARRKRSAFKGPMLHTSNLMVSGGSTVHSPLPGQAAGSGDAIPAVARPAARKSQIIEEEEDDEGFEDEIEEVEEFDDANEDIGTVSAEGDVTPRVSTTQVPEAGSPVSSRKLVLEPAPELESSPARPPRSSSLRSPTSETGVALAGVVAEPVTQDGDIKADMLTEAPSEATVKLVATE
jgi:hypothetical protein